MAMARQAAIHWALLSALCLSGTGYAQQQPTPSPSASRATLPVLTDGSDTAGVTSLSEDVIADEGFDVEQAALWQQPAAQPALPSLSTATNPRSTRSSRQSNSGLASVPNMFGDCGMTTAGITILGNGATRNAGFMLPMVGGSRTAKMSENDIAMPVDRVFVGYNHYANIFEMQSQQALPPGPNRFRQEPIDRYTLGAEKTFFDANTSVEVRMPFTGSFYATLPGIAVDSGNYGNMAVIFKALLYRGENLGIGGGLGLDLPTGSDSVARFDTVNLRFQNQAVHILPWLGFLYSPGDSQWGWGDNIFLTGFVQFDAAANGNNIRFENPGGGTINNLGKFNEQNVLFTDLSLGYWVYRNPMERLSGLAIVSELHYTTSMQNPDLVASAAGNVGATVTNPSNRFDVMNGTIGVQALMYDMSSLRVAGVFPFGDRMDQRFFDAELQVQFNRRF